MGDASVPEKAGARRRIIERPRLTRLLTASESRVMLLVAPAGYGKTTLARQWLRDRPHAWYQAAPHSRDVAALALGLAAAAAEAVPAAARGVRAQLKAAADLSDSTAVAAALIAELDPWPAGHRLVIDDYHFLSNGHAEAFIERIVSETTVPFLITSRVRPKWVTAKKLLYGEVVELGRTTLAMTHEEAAMTLAGGHDAMPGLVSLAQGWPAVIGLAALVPSLGEGDVPETLHEFFAEELYAGLSDDLKWNLAQLAIAPSLDDDVAEATLGGAVAEMLHEGYASGFLSRGPHKYEMHPLLRRFLRAKLREFPRDDVIATARSLAATYIASENWDDAVQVSVDQGLPEVVLDVLDAALEQMLSDGRITTVERWLERARAIAPAAPIVQLAEVEVAFRAGDASSARTKAPELARSISPDHPMASRIFFSAGQIAHLDDRLHEAVRFFSAAEGAAKKPSEFRRALWSRFVSLTDLDDPEGAADALNTLESVPAVSVDDVLRARQGRLQSALRWGGLGDALEATASALELVSSSEDPVVRTGFLQTYGIALVLAARYAEATAIAEEELREAERFKLDWVVPHALEMQASAALGLRDFRKARSTLRRIGEVARGNRHTELNVDVIWARVHLANGAPDRAVKLLKGRNYEHSSPGMQGDYLATLGLANACVGISNAAHQFFDAAEAVSSHVDARVSSAFGRVIAGIVDSGDTHVDVEGLSDACDISARTGNFESFVVAYRACPTLVRHLSRVSAEAETFVHLVCELDAPLAKSFGLRSVIPARSGDLLTAREREILELVRQGLSNREIARTVWIAESTVKVHVRHVFEKLGVKSRTEAAAAAGDVL